MPLVDGIYFLAFGLFLVGSSLHLRGVASRPALWLMAFSVVLDFYATIIPSSGFKSLAINIGAHLAIITGITLEISVWCLFLAAVFVRLMGKQPLFYRAITAIKILWFISLVAFMYGVYKQ